MGDAWPCVRLVFIVPRDHGSMDESPKEVSPKKLKAKHEKQVARLEATIESYKTEIRRLSRADERAEEDAAKWRRKAKKLKKRESTVIVDAALELAALPDIGDALSA